MIHGYLLSGYTTSLSSSSHKILSDLSFKDGGKDLGLNPHELLESALTACTLMTLEMYAKRKKWNTVGMKVQVRISSESLEHTVIEREIFLPEHLDTDQKNKLLQIANKCPIHRILSSQIEQLSRISN